jgi:hypothetical protein
MERTFRNESTQGCAKLEDRASDGISAPAARRKFHMTKDGLPADKKEGVRFWVRLEAVRQAPLLEERPHGVVS